MKKLLLATIVLTAIVVALGAKVKSNKKVTLYKVALYDQFIVLEIVKGKNPVVEIDDINGINKYSSVKI